MMKWNIKWLVAAILYCCFIPVALGEVRDTFHGTIQSTFILWDLLYNALAGAGGGLVQTIRNLQNPRKYSQNLAVELVANVVISSFAGIMTYFFMAGTSFVTISPVMMMFFSSCAGILGYEAIRKFTKNFTKNIKRITDEDNGNETESFEP